MKFGWHVTFLRKADWQIEKVTFISKAIVERIGKVGSNQTLQQPLAVSMSSFQMTSTHTLQFTLVLASGG